MVVCQNKTILVTIFIISNKNVPKIIKKYIENVFTVI
jgi:hypothetical protein